VAQSKSVALSGDNTAMNRQQWSRIDKLLDAALELDPVERKKFLDEACAGQEDLRKEIEELISADERARSFIEAPALQRFPDVLEGFPFKFGHYSVLRKIGQGGMGKVFLAEDDRLLRKVALKILPAEFTTEPDRLRRFQNEARAASALNHPNILVVYDIGEIGRVPFIATEYVDGETVRSKMSAGKVKVEDALEITLQAANALSSAHGAGIVHRDIKPENMIQRSDGYLKIVDFGVAKIIQSGNPLDAETATEAGAIIGTVKYMSPEQVRGLEVDARSDIFSLGVVLFEMLAGVAPFEGKTKSDMIAAILQKNPPPLSGFSPQIPNELQLIVTKMLQKEKRDRYQTSAELIDDLKAFKRKQNISTESPTANIRTIPKNSFLRMPAISAKFILITAAIILLALFGVYEFRKSFRNIQSIAVLPLVNVGNGTDSEYLTDGMTDTIIRSLSRLPHLRVMAQSTVLRYKNREVDPQTIGRELGVQAVVTGTLNQHGKDLLITIELANAKNNSYIWSHQYRGTASDLLSMQSEIATDLSTKLWRSSDNEKKLVTKKYTENVEAYDLYLKGRYFWSKRTKDGMEKAMDYFRDALDTDPNYALAWTGLADCYISRAFYEYAAPKDTMPQASEAAKKALAIDESLAEAHTTAAHVAVNWNWDWKTAEAEFARGIELNPNYPTAHQWYAIHYLLPLARFDQAFKELERSQQLDPLSPLMSSFAGEALYFEQRYKEAEQQCQKALAIAPDFAVAHWHLGLIYEQLGRYNEAISELRKAVELSGGSPRLLAALGHAFAVAGRKEEALDVIQQLKKREYVSSLELASIEVALGEKEQALTLLEDAYNQHSFHLTYLKIRPEFTPINTDPVFLNVARQIGLEAHKEK
jgi:eukaryotic-like serine/threonine-protein kinase